MIKKALKNTISFNISKTKNTTIPQTNKQTELADKSFVQVVICTNSEWKTLDKTEHLDFQIFAYSYSMTKTGT